MIIENICCATSRVNKGEFASSQDLTLINVGQEEAGTILSRYWKGIEGDHSNAIIVAMRGRNPTNPSDRTPGIELEQTLEVNQNGTTNCLTSVQKDNLVMEKVKIKQATKQGYIECEVGGVADFSYPDSKTRRGRVQDNGNTCHTLTAESQDICKIEKVGQISNDGSQYGTVIADNGLSPNLVAGTHGYANSCIATQYRIRKLTPRECWRLMDFSDEDF